MQKYANLVDLEKCCQTHVFLQNFVLIQPRTSQPKNCKICKICKKNANFATLLSCEAKVLHEATVTKDAAAAEAQEALAPKRTSEVKETVWLVYGVRGL